jgi:zinc D-Ala-D-Ala carboxypeptidase
VNLSEHFTLAEFVATQHRGIDNTLPAKLMPQALETAAMLDRIRTVLSSIAGHDVPVLISSGYRCPALNAAVGGSANSDHLKALAADWIAPAFGTPHTVCKALAPRIDALGIGQLIHEFGRWVHVSSRTPAVASNRVITITAAGTRLGIQEA